MNEMIHYNISFDKLTEVIVWLAKMSPSIDIYHVAKVLFYADKMHINRYGRPITGDTYVKMDYGPVPSGAYDLIKENRWLSPKHLKQIKDSLLIDKSDQHLRLQALREPDMTYFSRSDLKCLEESLSEYACKSFDELYTITHSEKCYCETDLKEKIDYALFIEDDNPFKKEILQDMEEGSRYIQV